MNEVPMSIPNLILTKNYLTASFLWRSKSLISTTTVYGVERYLCLFDVIDLQNMMLPVFCISVSFKTKKECLGKNKIGVYTCF